eukprot:4880801-Pyramimonas_sp.AAC.1
MPPTTCAGIRSVGTALFGLYSTYREIELPSRLSVRTPSRSDTRVVTQQESETSTRNLFASRRTKHTCSVEVC